MKKRKLKKRALLLLLSSSFLLIIVGLLVFFKNESDLLKSIKRHYGNYVVVTNNTKLYDKNYKVVGDVKKGIKFNLDNLKIENTDTKYFKIKDTSYYLYYNDIKKCNKYSNEYNNDKYVVFNSNVKTLKKTKLYKDGKLKLNIDKEMSFPIQYMDDNYYYVNYLNYLFQINKKDKSKIEDKENTNIAEANNISILHYESISSEISCGEKCINIDKFKEQIKYLNDNGYYMITLDQYKMFLKKQVRLKEKAILLTTSSNNDLVNEINKNEIIINVLSDDIGLKFNDSNKTTNKDTNVDSVDRYIMKANMSDDIFKKMVEGVEIVDEVKSIIEKTTSNNSGEQSIPVLNYHFFYDSSIGEACNENICLDTAMFRRHLDYLKQNGYKTLKMEEFRKWMYGEIELPEKSVLITIDDGAMGTGKHNGNKLIPILEEYNMNATLFLITGWWDVNNYRSKNLDIQSHTHDMHQYGTCGKGQVVCASKEELLQDLRTSLTIVDK